MDDFFIYFFCVYRTYTFVHLFTILEMSHTVRYQAGCCDCGVCAAWMWCDDDASNSCKPAIDLLFDVWRLDRLDRDLCPCVCSFEILYMPKILCRYSTTLQLMPCFPLFLSCYQLVFHLYQTLPCPFKMKWNLDVRKYFSFLGKACQTECACQASVMMWSMGRRKDCIRTRTGQGRRHSLQGVVT